MTPEQWKDIEHFSIDEKTPWGDPAWGDPAKMQLGILLMADKLRGFTGHLIRVHCGFQDRSRHRNGTEIDCSCPTLDVWEFYHQATKFPFDRIGVYECWNNQGLHLGYGGNSLNAARVEWWAEAVGFDEVTKDPIYKYHYF